MHQKWWVLSAVACGTFMATLDSSIVNLALTAFTREFHVDLGQVRWIIILYFLVITCFLLPFGKVSDFIGRKRVFIAGYITFTIGSLLCGLAPSQSWLLFFRTIQALGSAMIMANGPAIITAAFPTNERGSALGILSMAVSAGLISGPALGGFLIQSFGWRSIFLVNLPFGILGAVLVLLFTSDGRKLPENFKFDWLGTAFQSALFGALLLFFDLGNILHLSHQGEIILRTVLTLVIMLLAAGFLIVESIVPQPLIDLTLFRIRVFWVAALSGLLNFVAYMGVALLFPYFLENVLNLDTEHAGRFMTLIPLSILLVAPVSGYLSDRFGSRELCILGAGLVATSIAVMSGVVGPGLNAQWKDQQIMAVLLCVGIGLGLFQSPNNSAILSAVPKTKLGVASALIAALRNLALAIGTGLNTELFAWKYRLSHDVVSSIHLSLIVSAGVGILATLIAAAKTRGPHWR